ncbi:MAG TPA: hypothetical protein VLU25_12130 [Acidobacteriota bacterium]|nr:hypothetical protein [Acidobacteriota bacterium]
MGSDVREVCRALIRRYSPARPQEQSPQEAGIGTNAPKSRKGKCPLSAETVAFVGALVYRFPALLPVLEEHLQDQDGEVLSHVFFGDLTRWIVGRLETAGRKDRILREILDFMEHAFGRGEGEVQELIAVSFLENLPSPGEPGSEIRSLLGPLLQEQLKRMRL